MTRFRSALVTGASGFIGRVLVRRLLDQGVAITTLARPSSARIAGADAIAVPALEPDALAGALAGRRFDVTFHLAAYGVAPGDRDPGSMFAANVAGTAALVEAAARRGCGAFVYVGSCSEYETPQADVPIGEDAPLSSATLYGASKAAGGLWGQALGRDLGMAFQWVRLFGVFGPGEAPHRLLPSLAGRLSRHETVALSPGEQSRDLLHVDDVATGLRLAAEAALKGQLGPYNLCSGRSVTVRWIAEQVAKHLDKPQSLLNFGALPYRPGEPLWLVGQPDRFAEATGFRPGIPLEDGIAATLDDLLRTEHAEPSS